MNRTNYEFGNLERALKEDSSQSKSVISNRKIKEEEKTKYQKSKQQFKIILDSIHDFDCHLSDSASSDILDCSNCDQECQYNKIAENLISCIENSNSRIPYGEITNNVYDEDNEYYEVITHNLEGMIEYYSSIKHKDEKKLEYLQKIRDHFDLAVTQMEAINQAKNEALNEFASSVNKLNTEVEKAEEEFETIKSKTDDIYKERKRQISPIP